MWLERASDRVNRRTAEYQSLATREEREGHAFEHELRVPTLDLKDLLLKAPPSPWLEFWLNPWRLRVSDFLMRWSQGVWSEPRQLDKLEIPTHVVYWVGLTSPHAWTQPELSGESESELAVGTIKGGAEGNGQDRIVHLPRNKSRA